MTARYTLLLVDTSDNLTKFATWYSQQKLGVLLDLVAMWRYEPSLGGPLMVRARSLSFDTTFVPATADAREQHLAIRFRFEGGAPIQWVEGTVAPLFASARIWLVGYDAEEGYSLLRTYEAGKPVAQADAPDLSLIEEWDRGALGIG